MMNNYFINWIPSFLFIVFALNFIIKIWKRNARKKKMLPPGPWKLPIIGNIHQLVMMGGSLPHHTLKSLAQKYGDLMHLQIGEISTLVVSSPRVAKAVLKTHDLAFANRPEIMLGKIIAYDYSDIVFSPYGEYWRQLRKICFLELLSTKNVRSLGSIRQDEALKLVSSVREEALLRSKHGINMTRKISSYTSSMVCRAAFGRAFGRHQDELIELLREVLILVGGFDVSDVFPSWKILHHLSSKPKLVELHRKIDEILEVIHQEHVENPTGRNGEFGQEDLIDVLLRIKRSGDLDFPITNTTIKAIILDMFTGGTDTSATTVEWAMAEIIRNPNVLEKLQNEIKGVTLPEKKTIEETDIQKLTYLKMVIKETLRLHPPLPLLVPRESREQCKIDEYIIPQKTRVIVNAWAIGRDSDYWNEPENFIPERFENNFTDFMGNDCEYLPFGIGRRSCPGMSFALANVEVPLANMLFYFDWKLPNDINRTDFDMSETHGITAPRKNKLFLVPSMYEESFNKL